MNILIPHRWLLDHLDTQAEPTEIQAQLSLAGPSVERIIEAGDEKVYDIEVTTNRVDAMSVRGIAREAAVILPKSSLKKQSLIDLTQLQPDHNVTVRPLPKIINHPELNQRTLCVVLTDLKRKATPKWMAERLAQVDLNVHEAVIDITNYVTHDLGHPCHAFDYDKLMAAGGEIEIVEAGAGEKFVTLDGEEFETVGGEVVFKNGQGEIIDLPSIKGTANTSIDKSTKNILLLIESIRPDKVRFASMTHAIRTTAAQLMEKGVDPRSADQVMAKGIQLYQEICQAKVASPVFDEKVALTQPATIKLSLKKIDQYLGLELKSSLIIQILEKLGCEVVIEDPEKQSPRAASLIVTPPTFRPDLTIPADIVEEIARIYGYHQLPSQIMATAIPLQKQAGVDFDFEHEMKSFLAAIGWQEVYTYSLVSQEIALQSGYELSDQLQLANPLTTDRVYLRRSLLPSLAEVIEANSQRDVSSVFELANVYHPQAKHRLPKEELQLGLVSNRSYRQVRGELAVLLDHFYVSQYEIIPSATPPKQFAQAAKITAVKKNKQAASAETKQVELGQIGQLKSGLFAVELKIAALLLVKNNHPQYQPLSKYMPIVEDLTFTLPASTQVGAVMKTIQQEAKIIAHIELKDIYQNNFTFGVEYHRPRKKVTAAEVQQAREKVVKKVAQKFQGKLVGAL